MYSRVGSCSNCGGDVMGYRGAWYGVTLPPPDECSSCGAKRADDVIKMQPKNTGSKKITKYDFSKQIEE